MNDHQGPWPGHSKGPGCNLQKAIDDAWEQAKGGGAPADLRIVDIQVTGNNPITEYTVILGPRP